MSDHLPSQPAADWPSRAEMMAARAEAIPRLERAAGNWRRVVAGVGAVALGLGGALIGGATLDYIDTHGSDGETTTGLVLAALLVAGGTALGFIVWRAGRAVNNALIAWEGMPDVIAPDGSLVDPAVAEAADARTPAELAARRREQWIQNRVRLYTPSRVGRIALGVAALLPGIAATIFALAGPGRDEGAATQVGVLGVGVVLLAAGVVVFGGQLRFGWCLTRRDVQLRRDYRRLRKAAGH